ncbi:MAG: choice-of-anchor Q domain-containing protein [Candidatus Binataceae bacterium]
MLVALLIVLVPLCVVVLQPAPKAAGAITVNTTDDPGTATECSLRGAIENANSQSTNPDNNCIAGTGTDTIEFTVGGAIALGSSLPAIQNDLTIDGSGQTVTADGDNLYGVLLVNSGATLDLENLTIAHGNAPYGGGVENDGTLTVTNVTFSANSAQWGGGIFNDIFGTLTVADSTFSGNQAQYGAGGIYNAGSYTSGMPTITNSTFSGNSAQYGGAVFSDVFSFLTVTNATFSGNAAQYYGGNIYSNTGTHGGSLTVTNSILANAGSGGNCHGKVIDGGYNISDDGSCGFASSKGANGDTIGDGVDPILALAGLYNNGGPTETIALESTSPAIDAVPIAGCPATDQRGARRPDPSGSSSACDIGAFEFDGVVPAGEGGKLSVTPLSVNFGMVKVRTTVKETVTVKNSGKGLLNLTVGNDLPPPFGENGAGSFPLGQGKSHKVVVTFTPPATGAATPQMLMIDSDDPNHRHLNVQVTGSGE